MKRLPRLLCAIVILIAHLPLTASNLQVAPVQTIDVPRIYRLDGEVEAVHRGTMTAQTSGQVEEVRVDVDDFVEQGELIIVLRATAQQAALSQAQANLNGAVAKRAEAEKEFERVRSVHARKLAAKADLDRATAAMDAARATEHAAAAAVERAEEEVEHTRILAPYTGIVTARHIQVGETALPGRALISGISLEKLRVAVDVPQNLVGAIRQNSRAFIEQPGEGWLPTSQVTVFPYADPASNTFKVRLALDQTRGMFPGMFVKVGFVVGTRKVLLAPASAIVFRSEVVGAYVVDSEGRVNFRHVRVGHELNEGRLVVLSGLRDGERVAIDPISAAVLLKTQRSAQ